MRLFPATLLLAATVLAAGCQQQERQVSASGAWIRLPAVTGRPAAAYFTLHGGTAPAVLLSVRTPVAIRTELHETTTGAGGMMSMAPVEQVDLAPGATVEFAPGGKHVMLFDVAPDVKPGEKVPLTFAFADGKSVEVQADVRAAGDDAGHPGH